MEGIYMIKNKINKKVYIGESIHIENRWESHIDDLLNKKHNRKLNEDVKKYGINSFEFSVIKEVPRLGLSTFKHQLLLLIYEDLYIRKYSSVNNGYNCQYTLNCIRDGRKKTLGVKIGLKTINNLIDIMYGTIIENDGKYSLEKEIEYREKYRLNKIDDKSLLNFKLRQSYKDYSFIEDMVSLIKVNNDKIAERIMQSYKDQDVVQIPCKTELEQSCELYVKFIDRFKFAIAEYIYTLKYIKDIEKVDDFEWCGVSRYLTYNEFKLIKKDILSNFNNVELDNIEMAIYHSADILFNDNNFEIPSRLIPDVLEEYAIDYFENTNWRYDSCGEFDDIKDLFSSTEEMIEYLESN